MNIPLDNLYHWVHGCASDLVTLYTFSSHGSKNIADLSPFEIEYYNRIAPDMVCHDQEPLDFDMCQTVDIFQLWQQVKKSKKSFKLIDQEIKSLVPYYKNLNFHAVLGLYKSRSIFDRYILLHSEKNSADVEKFSCNAEPVYYWSHAIIARDWYRFAQHDPRLNCTPVHKKTFLVYCRAWTGTREYRLKFLDQLAEQNLLSHCYTSILHQDQEFELDSYKCTDPKFQPGHQEQLNSLAENMYPAHASADYCAEDIVNTDISIVLETVAADTKIHLTEKTLRPIACGHPFILIAGHGSLEYLRSYGFKTFSPWIDERYDQEPDVVKRMKMVADQMTQIKNLSAADKKHMLLQLKKIAMYNKRHFFSNKFFNQVQAELIENLNTAMSQIKITQGRHYLAKKILIRKFRVRPMGAAKTAKKIAVAKILRRLRQDPYVSLKQIASEYPRDFFQ